MSVYARFLILVALACALMVLGSRWQTKGDFRMSKICNLLSTVILISALTKGIIAIFAIILPIFLGMSANIQPNIP